MSGKEIRRKYLDFFVKRGHLELPSASLIPKNDPSLLMIGAGMAPFKAYFTGKMTPPCTRITTSQRCVRTGDIENVGRTARHHTYFEMLGNFSFGDYFKYDAIRWAWEFLTVEMELPKDKLWATIYPDDEEAYKIWTTETDINPAHIVKLEDNFWDIGSGPCGPDSEIYIDLGEERGCGKPTCGVGCDCDRYLEIWNLVFTQFDHTKEDPRKPLVHKNIDTGCGLERLASVLQNKPTNFETDLMFPIIEYTSKVTHKEYGKDPKVDVSLKVIADHARSLAFMVMDGILPSNEGRGYVLRRLLRRAVMHGRELGIEGPFLSEYIAQIVEQMGTVYPEIVENRGLVERVVLSEEERFGATLRQGRAYLDAELAKLSGDVLSGEQAFTLHDTYGFPVEVTEEICGEQGIAVDKEGFERCMQAQRERARAATKDDAEAAWSTYGGVHADILKEVGATGFVGYDSLNASAAVCALLKDGERVSELHEGDSGEVVLSMTPFYAEMGGEVGDTGTIEGDGSLARVVDTKAPEKGLVCHMVKVERGTLREGDAVRAVVDELRRKRITRNHTATHILHAALRKVLGDHVKQAGSYVGPDRLRFDFTHFEATTPEQIAEVERVANDVIMRAYPMNIYETTLSEAREAGVTALFGEKYGDTVRVVEAGDFSAELCGGCHVSNTAEIGLVKIVSETSVGANLRRIEAVTSFDALAYLNAEEAELKAAAEALRAPVLGVAERAAAAMESVKRFEAASKQAARAAAEGSVADYLKDTVDVGYPLLVARIDGLDAGALRNAWDMIRARMPKPGACVIGTVNDGKPVLMAAATDEAVAAGFDAGAVIKGIAGAIKGGGGGKPTMAQAGGKDASGIDAALSEARKLLGA